MGPRADPKGIVGGVFFLIFLAFEKGGICRIKFSIKRAYSSSLILPRWAGICDLRSGVLYL